MAVETESRSVGREDELDLIHEFLKRGREDPIALVLEGPAGIGETTLWRAGVELAQERGFLVLQARPGNRREADVVRRRSRAPTGIRRSPTAAIRSIPTQARLPMA